MISSVTQGGQENSRLVILIIMAGAASGAKYNGNRHHCDKIYKGIVIISLPWRIKFIAKPIQNQTSSRTVRNKKRSCVQDDQEQPAAVIWHQTLPHQSQRTEAIHAGAVPSDGVPNP